MNIMRLAALIGLTEQKSVTKHGFNFITAADDDDSDPFEDKSEYLTSDLDLDPDAEGFTLDDDDEELVDVGVKDSAYEKVLKDYKSAFRAIGSPGREEKLENGKNNIDSILKEFADQGMADVPELDDVIGGLEDSVVRELNESLVEFQRALNKAKAEGERTFLMQSIEDTKNRLKAFGVGVGDADPLLVREDKVRVEDVEQELADPSFAPFDAGLDDLLDEEDSGRRRPATIEDEIAKDELERLQKESETVNITDLSRYESFLGDIRDKSSLHRSQELIGNIILAYITAEYVGDQQYNPASLDELAQEGITEDDLRQQFPAVGAENQEFLKKHYDNTGKLRKLTNLLSKIKMSALASSEHADALSKCLSALDDALDEYRRNPNSFVPDEARFVLERDMREWSDAKGFLFKAVKYDIPSRFTSPVARLIESKIREIDDALSYEDDYSVVRELDKVQKSLENLKTSLSSTRTRKLSSKDRYALTRDFNDFSSYTGFRPVSKKEQSARYTADQILNKVKADIRHLRRKSALLASDKYKQALVGYSEDIQYAIEDLRGLKMPEVTAPDFIDLPNVPPESKDQVREYMKMMSRRKSELADLDRAIAELGRREIEDPKLTRKRDDLNKLIQDEKDYLELIKEAKNVLLGDQSLSYIEKLQSDYDEVVNARGQKFHDFLDRAAPEWRSDPKDAEKRITQRFTENIESIRKEINKLQSELKSIDPAFMGSTTAKELKEKILLKQRLQAEIEGKTIDRDLKDYLSGLIRTKNRLDEALSKKELLNRFMSKHGYTLDDVKTIAADFRGYLITQKKDGKEQAGSIGPQGLKFDKVKRTEQKSGRSIKSQYDLFDQIGDLLNNRYSDWDEDNGFAKYSVSYGLPEDYEEIEERLIDANLEIESLIEEFDEFSTEIVDRTLGDMESALARYENNPSKSNLTKLSRFMQRDYFSKIISTAGFATDQGVINVPAEISEKTRQDLLDLVEGKLSALQSARMNMQDEKRKEKFEQYQEELVQALRLYGQDPEAQIPRDVKDLLGQKFTTGLRKTKDYRIPAKIPDTFASPVIKIIQEEKERIEQILPSIMAIKEAREEKVVETEKELEALRSEYDRDEEKVREIRRPVDTTQVSSKLRKFMARVLNMSPRQIGNAAINTALRETQNDRDRAEDAIGELFVYWADRAAKGLLIFKHGEDSSKWPKVQDVIKAVRKNIRNRAMDLSKADYKIDPSMSTRIAKYRAALYHKERYSRWASMDETQRKRLFKGKEPTWTPQNEKRLQTMYDNLVRDGDELQGALTVAQINSLTPEKPYRAGLRMKSLDDYLADDAAETVVSTLETPSGMIGLSETDEEAKQRRSEDLYLETARSVIARFRKNISDPYEKVMLFFAMVQPDVLFKPGTSINSVLRGSNKSLTELVNTWQQEGKPFSFKDVGLIRYLYLFARPELDAVEEAVDGVNGAEFNLLAYQAGTDEGTGESRKDSEENILRRFDISKFKFDQYKEGYTDSKLFSIMKLIGLTKSDVKKLLSDFMPTGDASEIAEKLTSKKRVLSDIKERLARDLRQYTMKEFDPEKDREHKAKFDEANEEYIKQRTLFDAGKRSSPPRYPDILREGRDRFSAGVTADELRILVDFKRSDELDLDMAVMEENWRKLSSILSQTLNKYKADLKQLKETGESAKKVLNDGTPRFNELKKIPKADRTAEQQEELNNLVKKLNTANDFLTKLPVLLRDAEQELDTKSKTLYAAIDTCTKHFNLFNTRLLTPSEIKAFKKAEEELKNLLPKGSEYVSVFTPDIRSTEAYLDSEEVKKKYQKLLKDVKAQEVSPYDPELIALKEGPPARRPETLERTLAVLMYQEKRVQEAMMPIPAWLSGAIAETQKDLRRALITAVEESKADYMYREIPNPADPSKPLYEEVMDASKWNSFKTRQINKIMKSIKPARPGARELESTVFEVNQYLASRARNKYQDEADRTRAKMSEYAREFLLRENYDVVGDPNVRGPKDPFDPDEIVFFEVSKREAVYEKAKQYQLELRELNKRFQSRQLSEAEYNRLREVIGKNQKQLRQDDGKLVPNSQRNILVELPYRDFKAYWRNRLFKQMVEMITDFKLKETIVNPKNKDSNGNPISPQDQTKIIDEIFEEEKRKIDEQNETIRIENEEIASKNLRIRKKNIEEGRDPKEGTIPELRILKPRFTRETIDRWVVKFPSIPDMRKEYEKARRDMAKYTRERVSNRAEKARSLRDPTAELTTEELQPLLKRREEMRRKLEQFDRITKQLEEKMKVSDDVAKKFRLLKALYDSPLIKMTADQAEPLLMSTEAKGLRESELKRIYPSDKEREVRQFRYDRESEKTRLQKQFDEDNSLLAELRSRELTVKNRRDALKDALRQKSISIGQLPNRIKELEEELSNVGPGSSERSSELEKELTQLKLLQEQQFEIDMDLQDLEEQQDDVQSRMDEINVKLKFFDLDTERGIVDTFGYPKDVLEANEKELFRLSRLFTCTDEEKDLVLSEIQAKSERQEGLFKKLKEEVAIIEQRLQDFRENRKIEREKLQESVQMTAAINAAQELISRQEPLKRKKEKYEELALQQVKNKDTGEFEPKYPEAAEAFKRKEPFKIDGVTYEPLTAREESILNERLVIEGQGIGEMNPVLREIIMGRVEDRQKKLDELAIEQNKYFDGVLDRSQQQAEKTSTILKSQMKADLEAMAEAAANFRKKRQSSTINMEKLSRIAYAVSKGRRGWDE